MSRIDETRPFVPVGIAVLTVSDTRSLEDDRSGDTLAARIEAAGHRLAARQIVPDDVEAIRAAVAGWTKDEAIDVVITTGGTGFYRPRRDARSAGAAVRKAYGRVFRGLPPHFLRTRSAPRRSSLAPPAG